MVKMSKEELRRLPALPRLQTREHPRKAGKVQHRFEYNRGRWRWGPRSVRRAPRRECRECGVATPPRLRSFRRAFALLSVRGGADLISLQRLLGHAELWVLRSYLWQRQQNPGLVHEKHGPVDHAL
jgi:site-specific recombinase XerD